MDKETIIYACKLHVEMAIDDFVNNAETAPQIQKVEGEKCMYCKEDAEYKVNE
jgi:CxxH/CxxC protein (TIGR04129 family)